MKSSEIDQWLDAYDNPMKPVVIAMREIITQADPRVEECIKWQAPTFTYKGNIASFHPNSKKHASLLFHKGAEIEGNFPNLQGDGKEARTFKVSDLDDLAEKQDELSLIIKSWCDLKDKI
jgi:hypothetical protein